MGARRSGQRGMVCSESRASPGHGLGPTATGRALGRATAAAGERWKVWLALALGDALCRHRGAVPVVLRRPCSERASAVAYLLYLAGSVPAEGAAARRGCRAQRVRRTDLGATAHRAVPKYLHCIFRYPRRETGRDALRRTSCSRRVPPWSLGLATRRPAILAISLATPVHPHATRAVSGGGQLRRDFGGERYFTSSPLRASLGFVRTRWGTYGQLEVFTSFHGASIFRNAGSRKNSANVTG